MKPADVVRALAYPASNQTVLMAFVAFYLLLELIAWIIGLGLFFFVSALILTAFIVPAMCLYLVFLLDARARGADPDPPNIEHLHWYGSVWSLLQILYYAVVIYTTYQLANLDGAGGLVAVIVLVAVALPASLAILAVTHSPVESLNPFAIRRLIDRCGGSYWVAPTYFLAAIAFAWWLATSLVPDWLSELIGLYLLFAFYALTGEVVRPYRLHDEVDIYEPTGPSEVEINASALEIRTDVLNHAYGFISRGNRAGGFKHIRDWIEEDPDPDSAWRWYFEQMMRWKKKEPALFFAQQYVGRLLHDGEVVAAVKMIMRCRLENEMFKPLAEDRELAIEAARRCGNDDLVTLLERS